MWIFLCISCVSMFVPIQFNKLLKSINLFWLMMTHFLYYSFNFRSSKWIYFHLIPLLSTWPGKKGGTLQSSLHSLAFSSSFWRLEKYNYNNTLYFVLFTGNSRSLCGIHLWMVGTGKCKDREKEQRKRLKQEFISRFHCVNDDKIHWLNIH